MPRYRRLSDVTLVVSDVARSRAFYSGLAGLEPLDDPCPRGAARFSVGGDGTILTLEPGASPGLRRFAFEMESDAELATLVRVLTKCGVACTDTSSGIRIVDPHLAATVEFHRPRADPAPPAQGKGAIAGLGHIVLATAAYREAVAFWRESLGFRLSDEIDGRISLLRCFPNPMHHSLGIASGPRTRFHHLSLRAADECDFEGFARTLARSGGTIASGPGTHTPSGNRFLYFFDPDGLTLEISTVNERFEEGFERAPRVLPDRPESFAEGNVARHPRMYAAGEIEEVSSRPG